MAALTVFLAPDGPSDGVLDVLTDLSAAGLLDPFLWVRESQVESSADIRATAITSGRRKGVSLGDVILDEVLEHDRIRLCVVVPIACGGTVVPFPVEQRVAEMMAHSGSARVTRIRCVIARPGSAAPDTDVARLGWHNVMVAPEEAHGPGGQRRELGASTDPSEVGQHAAPVVAGVMALWSGQEGCPLDVPPQEGLRVVRAFYRRIDAGPVEQALRERVLSTGPELPTPRGWADPVVHLDDPTEACREMADRLWARHVGELVGRRESPRNADVVDLNGRTALLWLWRFVLAALRNWPADWLTGRRNERAVADARRLQRVVLGAGSAYAVVVRGMTEDNVPAGWRDVGVVAADIDERLVAEGLADYRPPAELAEMWVDYRNGAFSLVDGGDRQGMPPRQLNDGRRAILRFADDCVPTPERRFTGVPGQVAARVGTESVQAGDVLGALLLRDRLDHLAGAEPMQAQAAGAVIGDLTDWLRRHERSYSVQVGRRIAGALQRTVEEIKRYLVVLERATREDPAEPTWRESRALVLWIRVLAVLAVLGLVAGPVLGIAGVVNTRVAVTIAGAPVLLWVVVVIAAFVDQQRRIFQEINRRRSLMSEAEAARVNLRQAVSDVRRLQDAYEQYLVWSHIVGALLQRPYGPPVASRAGSPRIARGLPRTTRVAQAMTDDREVGFAADALRPDQFEISWFGNLWDSHVHDAVERLRLHQFADRPDDMTRLRGRRVADTPLQAWADLLEREGTSRTAGDRAWAERLRSLDGKHAGLAGRLLSSVRVTEGGDRRTVALEEFLAAVNQPDEAVRGQEFAPAHFREEARAQQWTAVEFQHAQRSPIGLSRVSTLVQFGLVLPQGHYVVTATGPRPVPEVPAPPTYPGDPPPATPPVDPAATLRPVAGGLVPPAPDGFA